MKKITSIILTVLMLAAMFTVCAVPASAEALSGFAGGDGTKDNPYQIATVEQLENLSEIVNGGNNCAGIYFILTNNIGDENDKVTTVIGNSSRLFSGNFDGNGYTVTLAIELPQTSYIGLFGALGTDGEIKNVITAGFVNGDSYAGGACGINSHGTITNCFNTATMNGVWYVGGVCGYNYGTLTNCYNTANVSGTDFVGGVCGYNAFSPITNCYNTANVSGRESIGGVCGENLRGTIMGCYYDSEKYTGDACGKDAGTVTDCQGLATALMTAASGTEGALVDKLNSYVNQNPGLGLLNWKKGEGGYPCLDFTLITPAGSILSGGALWIIAAVAVVAVAGVATLVVVKKKKKA